MQGESPCPSSSSCSPRSAAPRAPRHSTATRRRAWRPGSRRSPTRPGCSCSISCRPPTAAEACVCDLTAALGLSQGTVSHHLKVLVQAGLLERERRGTWAWYRLVPGALTALAGTLTVPAEGARARPVVGWRHGSRARRPHVHRHRRHARAGTRGRRGAGRRRRPRRDLVPLAGVGRRRRRRPRPVRRRSRRRQRRSRRPRPASSPPPTTTFGRLDGALISVGGPPAGPIAERTDDEWRAAFDSVFLGALRLATTVADALTEGGSIAFVLSTSVKAPIPDLGISNGLRPGLAMAAKTLADELGPRGIRVNGLLPGTGRHRSGAGARRQLGRRSRRQGESAGRHPAAALRRTRRVRPRRRVPALPRVRLPHRRDAPGRRRPDARL